MAIVNKAGHGGMVKISDDGTNFENVAFIRNWSVEETSDVVDSTTMDSGQQRSYKASLKTWTGTADLFIRFDDSDGSEAITSADTEVTAITVGGEFTFKFYPDDSQTTFENYTAKGIVTSISRSVALDGMAEMSISIQGTEALA